MQKWFLTILHIAPKLAMEYSLPAGKKLFIYDQQTCVTKFGGANVVYRAGHAHTKWLQHELKATALFNKKVRKYVMAINLMNTIGL